MQVGGQYVMETVSADVAVFKSVRSLHVCVYFFLCNNFDSFGFILLVSVAFFYLCSRGACILYGRFESFLIVQRCRIGFLNILLRRFFFHVESSLFGKECFCLLLNQFCC
jgi:hypothetical protein